MNLKYPVTAEQEEQIAGLITEGRNYAEISRILGIHKTAVVRVGKPLRDMKKYDRAFPAWFNEFKREWENMQEAVRILRQKAQFRR